MPYVIIVTVLLLLQYFWFGFRVAGARSRYGVAAPATSGHEQFERHFRVQMNTQEQLVMFLPLLWVCAIYLSPYWAAAAGGVFLVGRAIYAASYVRDPRSRTVGFALTALPTLALALANLTWAMRAILSGAV